MFNHRICASKKIKGSLTQASNHRKLKIKLMKGTIFRSPILLELVTTAKFKALSARRTIVSEESSPASVDVCLGALSRAGALESKSV